jgi:hypothetical protein
MLQSRTIQLFIISLSILLMLQTAPNTNQSGETGKQPPNEGFTLVRMGSEKADGIVLGFRIFENSLGTSVVVKRGTFESADKAENQLRAWIKPAKKIVLDVPKKNITGKIVGERVETIFHNDHANVDYTALFWTEGATLWLVQCTDRSVTLQFEDQISNGKDLAK